MPKKFWIFLSISLLCINTIQAASEVVNPSTTNLPRMQNPTTKTNDEVNLLSNLIDVTKKNLENQIQLKSLLVEYIQIKDQYMQNTDDKQLSYRMVQKAFILLDKIKEDYLTQLFDQEFISELTFFASIGAKWNNPNK